MFEFLYRIKELRFKKLNEYDKSIHKLLAEEKKIEYIIIFIYAIFSWLLTSLFIIPLVEREDIFSRIIAIIIGVIFIIIFIKITDNFMWKLSRKGTIITNFLFFSIYTLKGNAILREDCNKIKEYDKSLYHFIKTKECRGLCYQVCYYILYALKKGSIKFIAVKALEADNITNNFTLHVLYVNDGWCFDTISRKQYKVEEFMNLCRAKEFKSFSYSDIAGKSYNEFKKDNYSELKKWCEENDCYQNVV